MAERVKLEEKTNKLLTEGVDLTQEVLFALREAEKAWRRAGKISYGMLEQALDKRSIDFGSEEVIEVLNNLIISGKVRLDLSPPGYQTGERFTVSLV